MLPVALGVCLLPACVGASRSSAPAVPAAEISAVGTHDRSIEFGGLTRTYRVHVPTTYKKAEAAALVLAFHGRNGTGQAMSKLSNFEEVSDQKGFILVYPDGVSRSWNAGNGAGPAERRQVDDVGFTSELIDDLSRQFNIDRRRVYATGMSNGAMFVHRLACELSGKIAAVAPVAGTIATKIEEGCKPARPVPVLQVHGTDDTGSPWAGGRTLGGGQVVSVADTIRAWAARNQCASTPKVTNPAPGVSCETYAACGGGAEVMLYRVEGGGHTWPGGHQYLPKVIIGETNRTVSASQLIWDFFERHPLKEQ